MLERQLETYKDAGIYPFHMPGHKRQPMLSDSPYEIDVTEIPGFDNLHHPQGVIADDMKELAALYHSEHSYFLVNGSTAGNLAAIYAATKDGGKILMARNSHASAYHAAMLRHLRIEYLYPDIEETYGIAEELSVGQIKEALEENEDAQAVFITSPTYEGIVSDLPRIAEEAHSRNLPLIVDAAHGAHLGFHSYFPPSPIESGADIVIMSLHKTLPSLTQTAVLHLNGNLIDRERLENALRMFQTTSPSYVLMASISRCISFLKNHGSGAFQAYSGRLKEFYGINGNLQHLKVLQLPHQDPSKLIISTAVAGISGEALMVRLREEFSLEMEMASQRYLIAMTSLMDTEEGFQRLGQALLEIDRSLCREEMAEDAPVSRKGSVHASFFAGMRKTEEKIMEPWQAADLPSQWVSAEDAAGQIAAADILMYPPGIPVIVAGERMQPEQLDFLQEGDGMGLTVLGWKTDEKKENIYISCVQDQ